MTAIAMTCAMVMATRLAGNEEGKGKGKGGKGNGDSNEGGGQQRGQWRQGNDNSNKGSGQLRVMATKRAMVMARWVVDKD